MTSFTLPHVTASPDRLIYTLKETEVRLSLSRSSVRRLIDSNQLTPIRIGRAVRITRQEIERFVADRVAAATV